VIAWTIWAAVGLYLWSLARGARWAWVAGCGCYLAHVAVAFGTVYGWSHAVAVAETARQTRELFGVEAGYGVWFNYVFTAVWAGDAAWWVWGEASRARRARWVTWLVQGYMGFMVAQGAVVVEVLRRVKG
jgi:hypothetical protein